MIAYTLQFAIPRSDWSTGAAAAAGAEDGRKFSLLTGHGKFPCSLQRIVEGPAGQSSAKAAKQQASGSAKIDLLMAAFNAIALMPMPFFRRSQA